MWSTLKCVVHDIVPVRAMNIDGPCLAEYALGTVPKISANARIVQGILHVLEQSLHCNER